MDVILIACDLRARSHPRRSRLRATAKQVLPDQFPFVHINRYAVLTPRVGWLWKCLA